MRLWPLTLLAGLAAMLAVAPARAANEGPPDPVAVMQAAILKACQASGPQEMDDLAVDLPGITPVGPRRGQRMIIGGWRKIYPLEIGDLTIDWLAPRGLLHHIRLQLDLDDQGTPLLYAMVARGCRVKMARRMEYGSDQRPQRVQILDAEFMPTGENEALDPPVPAAEDPGGIPVAVIDTGVNYTLDHIVTRLSRGPDGALAGYDFWDMDNRPFDANPHRSAFFPARHGTAVSSILLSEAPAAELLIYRYPRPDMSRFGTIIDRAAAGGARVVNLSMASFHAEDWVPFRRAMAKHPEMLFVVAA
ncbi:MAG: S8/S53 family peptidase, partial [Pseudomonadota bacterium]